MNRTPWRQPEFWTTATAVAVVTAGHYLAPTDNPFWHDLFRRLYYLPIVLAGFRFGLRGALVASASVSLLFLPHVLMTREMLMHQASEAVFEIPLYLAVGILTGLLSDRQRKAVESLRRAERLKTLGEMAAGMAHEVKNPLAAIRSSAQLLGERLSGREAELAGIVVSEVDRTNRVVNDFLEYARPARPRRELVLLSGLVDSCLGLLDPVISRSGVKIERAYPGAEAQVSADPNQLRQVFTNLILNAVQAMESGEGQQRKLSIRIERAGAGVRVMLSDTGPGIPPDRLKRVFEPFYSTKPGGTGLGLPIAQQIVAGHSGRLELENAPGRGLNVSVFLPGD